MKRRTANTLLLALLASGCGGGSSIVGIIGSGGTGISPGGGVGSGGTGSPAGGVGAISGFGSIIVNGIRFDTDSASIVLADGDELRLGMTVRVIGEVERDLANGTAHEVLSAADLRGTVDSVEAPQQRFVAIGMPVTTDDTTVFAGGLASLADLRAGDAVQVHGLPGAGELRATRIERLAGSASLVLAGSVESLDTGEQTFRLGAATVRYGRATFDPSWPASRLAAGEIVRVRGAKNGRVLEATSVEPWYALAAEDGATLTIAGQVTEFTGRGAMRVDGVRVDASNARFSGGPASALGPGSVVEATGRVVGGVLVAERVRLRRGPDRNVAPPPPEPDTFSIEGTVSGFDSVDEFRVRGVEIDASDAEFVGGTEAELRPGRKVRVTGPRVEDDELKAARVEFLR